METYSDPNKRSQHLTTCKWKVCTHQYMQLFTLSSNLASRISHNHAETLRITDMSNMLRISFLCYVHTHTRSIIFASNISTVSCIHVCTCNINDGGLNNLIMIMASPWSRIRFCSYAAIINVGGADMDVTYGAYLAAEKWNSSGEIAQRACWDFQW